MADPFDATNSDTPPDPNAFLGVSPDAWRNLMTFGAATTAAANAHDGRGFLTYGTGPLGALGAGVLAATNSATTNAQARSDMARAAATKGYLQSQTQSQNLQNQLLQTQMPFAKAKAGLQMQMLNGMTGGVPAMPQTVPGGAPSVGPQSSAAPMASPLDPIINQAADANGLPRPLLHGVLAQESGKGTASPNIGQILPTTAANPGYGMAPLAPDQINNPNANINFTAAYLAKKAAANGVTDWSDPTQAAKGLQLYNGGGDPNYVQNVAQRMGSGAGQQPYQVAANGPVAPPQGAPSAQPSPTTPQSGIGPQGQLPPVLAGIKSQSDALMSRANQLEFLGLPGADILKSQAQAGYKTVYDATTKALEPTPIRPGGMNVNNLNGQVTMPPVMKPFAQSDGSVNELPVDPQTGAAVPGSIPRQTQIPLADKQNLEGRGAGWAKREGEINDQAVSAVGANNTLENMRAAAGNIDMGAGAGTLQTANTWLLSLGKSLGVDTSGLQNQVANTEDFNKNSVAMVSAATKAVSPRASQQEMQFIAKSQPSVEMSRGGFNMIADQMQGVNDFTVARAQALQDYINGNPQTGVQPHGNSGGFDVWFNQQVTPAAFTLQRMTQTPDGQERFKAMVSDLQQTPEGKTALKGMMTHYQNGQKLGLFSTPDDGGQ